MQPYKKKINELWQRGKNSLYLKNIFSLSSGAMFSQVITLALSPILTRLYTPSDFGFFSLFISYQAILIIFSTLKSEQMIMQEKKHYIAKNMLFFGIFWVFCFGTLLAIYISFFGPGDNFTKSKQPFWLFYFMILTLAMMAIKEILRYYACRLKDFKTISYIFVFISLFNSGLSILTGLVMNYGPVNLLISLFTVYFFSNFYLLRKFFKNTKPFKNFHLRLFLKSIKQKGGFMLSLSFSQMLGVLAMQIPAIFIGKHYGLSALGFYFLGYRLVTLPSQLLATSIGDVFRKHATDAFHKNGCYDTLFKNTFKLIFFVALPPYIFLYLTAPFLFKIVFGNEWIIAGEYTKILCLGSFFAFIGVPMDKGSVIRQKKKYLFFWNTSFLFLNILLIFTSYAFKLSIEQYLYGFAFINVLIYSTDLSYGYYLSKPLKNNISATEK